MLPSVPQVHMNRIRISPAFGTHTCPMTHTVSAFYANCDGSASAAADSLALHLRYSLLLATSQRSEAIVDVCSSCSALCAPLSLPAATHSHGPARQDRGRRRRHVRHKQHATKRRGWKAQASASARSGRAHSSCNTRSCPRQPARPARPAGRSARPPGCSSTGQKASCCTRRRRRAHLEG